MSDTVEPTETGKTEPLSNEVAPPAPAPAGNADAAEVEKLKKEKEQAEMRARQLQNQLEEKNKAEEANRQKQLEEKEEYKTLYESTQEKLRSYEQEREDSARQAELSAATDNIFKDYPTEVVELAKTAGLSLTDDSDVAQAALKEKLDAFKAKVAPNAPTASSSNPASTAVSTDDPNKPLGRPKTIGFDDEGKTLRDASGEKVHEYLSGLPAIKEMKRSAGLQVD